jgi:malonate transporter and related proteins
MLNILTITGPIYLIIAAGFLSVRFGLFTKPDVRVMGRFVIDFCLPALLFQALSQRSLAEVLHGVFLIAYAGASLAMLLGALAWSRLAQRKPMSLAALHGLGVSASNSGFIGYPIAMQLLGPPAAVALALCMTVENLLILPLALALADTGEPGRSNVYRALGHAGRGLLKNPMIVAIMLGVGFAMLEWKLPAALAKTVQLVATASSPVALFVIGGSLVGLKLGGVWADVSGVAIGKLVLHPLAVWALLALLPPIDPVLRTAAIVFACMPMLSIYPVLAQKYQHEGFCAAALLATTVLSFFSISAALALMHMGL